MDKGANLSDNNFFVGFATSYFASFATGYFGGFTTCYFGSTSKDSNSFDFAIDYCKDLKIVQDLVANLFLRPMVDVEQ